MQYIGINCPLCGEKFTDNDDVVVCPVCGTPHHRHCWKENGGCINAEKHQSGFIWQSPEVYTSQPNHSSSSENQSGDFKICPRCGSKNSPFEPVCTQCGERLKANRQTVNDQMPFGQHPFGGYGENPNPNNFSPYQNVYAADAKTVYGADAVIDDIPVSEVAEYVQKDSVKYIGKFLKMQDSKSKFSWNWSAGIFSVVWCFYRKMMACGIALLALFMASYLFSTTIPAVIYEKQQPEVYAEYEETMNDLATEMQSVLSEGASADTSHYYELASKLLTSPITVTSYIMMGALFLIISVVFGFFGNWFYRKRIVKDIHTLRQVAVDNTAYHMYMRQRGGVSVANVLIPLICYMAFNILSSYI